MTKHTHTTSKGKMRNKKKAKVENPPQVISYANPDAFLMYLVKNNSNRKEKVVMWQNYKIPMRWVHQLLGL